MHVTILLLLMLQSILIFNAYGLEFNLVLKASTAKGLRGLTVAFNGYMVL